MESGTPTPPPRLPALLAAGLATLAAAAPAAADAGRGEALRDKHLHPDHPGHHAHKGLFLRLGLGGGFMRAERETGARRFDIEDGIAVVNLAVGGALAEDVVLHVDVHGLLGTRPRIRATGTEARLARNDTNALSAALGLTYYMMPANVYLTLSAGLGITQIDATFVDPASGEQSVAQDETRYGLAANVLLGKEWWVGAGWGLGLAAYASGHALPDSLDTFHLWVAGGLLTVTVN